MSSYAAARNKILPAAATLHSRYSTIHGGSRPRLAVCELSPIHDRNQDLIVSTTARSHTASMPATDDKAKGGIPTNEKGEFVKPPSQFRNFITADGSSDFPAAAGRYHLYVSYACPWANRTLIGRALKGLESAISVTVVDPHMGEKGWQFSDTEPECNGDPVNGKTILREVYNIAEEGYTGRVSVPVLWDKEKKTVVNNESAEILRMFSTGVFDEFCATPEQKALDLYPEALRAEIEEVNELVAPNINNGVYKCGFGTSQEAYSTAVKALFDTMDKLEERLSNRRYLVGDQLTEADIRLAVTLFRFDTAYHGLFKCNKKMLVQYPNLWAYTRDIYQMPGVAATVNFYHINTHYWWSSATVNPTRIVPIGPELNWDEPHGREKLGK